MSYFEQLSLWPYFRNSGIFKCMLDAHCHLECFPEGSVTEFWPVYPIYPERSVSPELSVNRKTEPIKGVQRFFSLKDTFPFFYTGFHPWFLPPRNLWENSLGILEDFFCRFPQAALGEVGLDRFISVPLQEQEEFLCLQLNLAFRYSRPVCIHCVRAWDRLLPCLEKIPGLPVMVHDFNSSLQEAQRLMKSGIMLSFSPRLLLEKTSLQAVFNKINMDMLLLESDAPESRYFRSQSFPSNSSLYTFYNTSMNQLYEEAARIRGLPLEEFITIIRHNGTFFKNRASAGN